ncbi:MAG: hypothetical protein LAO31_19445 [Acidobacteriia bacterium]|nr:hypothetical protein [Terriglobia bacterium]
MQKTHACGTPGPETLGVETLEIKYVLNFRTGTNSPLKNTPVSAPV